MRSPRRTTIRRAAPRNAKESGPASAPWAAPAASAPIPIPIPIPVEAMLLDLALAFPGIDAEAGPENTRVFPGAKITAAVSRQLLAWDGEPVHLTADGDRPGYTGGLHDGVRSFLVQRGWNAVPSKAFPNYTMYLLLPLESIRAWRRERVTEALGNNQEDEDGA